MTALIYGLFLITIVGFFVTVFFALRLVSVILWVFPRPSWSKHEDQWNRIIDTPVIAGNAIIIEGFFNIFKGLRRDPNANPLRVLFMTAVFLAGSYWLTMSAAEFLYDLDSKYCVLRTLHLLLQDTRNAACILTK